MRGQQSAWDFEWRSQRTEHAASVFSDAQIGGLELIRLPPGGVDLISKILLVAPVVWWRRASSPQTLLRVIVCAMRGSEAGPP